MYVLIGVVDYFADTRSSESLEKMEWKDEDERKERGS
jgi:hypothetical protein